MDDFVKNSQARGSNTVRDFLAERPAADLDRSALMASRASADPSPILQKRGLSCGSDITLAIARPT